MFKRKSKDGEPKPKSKKDISSSKVEALRLDVNRKREVILKASLENYY